MKLAFTGSRLAFCLVVLSAGPAFSQTSEAIAEKPSSAPVAFVNIQTQKGVVAYAAAASGKLTKIKGSPFPVSGQMEAITGKYLISVGTDWLHVYELTSSGAVGKQVSKINTQSYAGGECGTTSELITDLTGKYIYVELYDYSQDLPADCTAWQSYSFESGVLNFLSEEHAQASPGLDVPVQYLGGAVNSSNKYIYTNGWDEADYLPSFYPLTIAKGNIAQNANFTEVDPTPDPNLDYFLVPVMAVADSKEHLAVLMMPWFYNDGGSAPENLKLASYTIDPSTGSITSTNTQDDIPFMAMQIASPEMSMSDDGAFVAVGAGGGFNTGGIQVFKFNGAKPPTALTKLLLPGVEIDQLAWDKQDHLYALSYAYNMSSSPEGKAELYVYSVGSTVKQVEGSPYSVPGAYGVTGMIVASK